MTVVVGYVPTPEGGAALKEGIRQATWRGTKLVVANVVTNQNFADVTAADEQDFDAVRARLDETGVAYEVQQLQAAGDVSASLVDVVESSQAELVVLAVRRVSLVGKLLLGSTIQEVLRHTSAQILIVRPQQW